MESVTLELRPRLRSLNAYISLIKNIDSMQLKIKKDSITLEVEGKLYTLPLSSVKLLPSFLSSLRVTKRWISFRIQTQPNSLFGTFGTEVIDLENKLNRFSINSTDNSAVLPSKNTNCTLLCSCCKNEITKSVNFKRILPLPSSDCDPQEWYCCGHDCNDKISLDPGESDLFYTFNHCVLNKHVFKENLKFKNSLIHCNRCVSIIGLCKDKEPKSFKIWNCCIEYKTLDDNQVTEGSSPLSDFLAAVKNTAEVIIGEQILLEARDVDNVYSILLRLMESKLNLFTEDKKNSTEQTLSLKSSFVVKVLFKYSKSHKTIKNNDPDLKHCEIALPSFLAGMDELVSSCARFPPVYRKTEDFFISYLPI